MLFLSPKKKKKGTLYITSAMTLAINPTIGHKIYKLGVSKRL
jgi:hypothetical protein